VRNQVEDAGLRLNAIENLPYEHYDEVMLGGDRQDEQLEHIKTTIRNMGKAGIPTLGYNWMPSGVWRTSKTRRIRGGAQTGALDVNELEEVPLTHGRVYTEAELWDNYERFLEEVLPVAEEAGVKLALHPNDPPISSIGGIPQLFRNFENFKRAMEMVPSDNHGLEFCLGNWSAMGADIADAIDYFGSRGKLTYVHFQTVSSSLPELHETFVDQEGYYDPYEVLVALDEADFSGMIIPGHVPRMNGDDDWKERGRAFTVGYLKSMIEAVQRRHG
jgi:mannonate dehydratase